MDQSYTPRARVLSTYNRAHVGSGGGLSDPGNIGRVGLVEQTARPSGLQGESPFPG